MLVVVSKAADELFGALQSAEVLLISVATVSEDTCHHTNAYSNPLHGAVIYVPCDPPVASALFHALLVCNDMAEDFSVPPV
eukprot:scaffold17550_cov130-Cyclotella_meneghiniana.AAC.1